jgi:hypothetical protein
VFHKFKDRPVFILDAGQRGLAGRRQGQVTVRTAQTKGYSATVAGYHNEIRSAPLLKAQSRAVRMVIDPQTSSIRRSQRDYRRFLNVLGSMCHRLRFRHFINLLLEMDCFFLLLELDQGCIRQNFPRVNRELVSAKLDTFR